MRVNLQCFGRNDERDLVGREVWNTVTLSLSFALAFTSYTSLQVLQSSLNQRAGLGVTSLACLYAFVIISCICAPTVIKIIGGKLSLVTGWIVHIVYIASNFYPTFVTLIPSSILLGLISGCLWTSQGLFLAVNGASLAKRKNQDSHAVFSKLNGLFFTIHGSSHVTGNIISSLILKRGSYDGFKNTTKSCGSLDCPLSVNATEITEPESQVVYTLLGIYLVFDIVALLVTVIFISPLPMSKWSKDSSLKSSISSCFTALGDYRVLLLLPIFGFMTIEQGILWADFTKSFISCRFGIQNVGYIMATYGASNVISNIVLSRIASLISRQFLFALGFTINMSILLMLYFWTPDREFYLFIIALMWGIPEGVWRPQANALISLLFPDKKEPMFANMHCWIAITTTASFITSNYLCSSTKLSIAMVLCSVAVASYTILEIIVKKKGKETEIELEIEVTGQDILNSQCLNEN
ncbi:hypothetical protein KUTeg_007460 [Tegillarca granosa]|uniref:UNC93-like protein n=1 Tax=Tegillarca granosa TaxID=220873 RepID=A0ABQ9FGC5_TEGGR|nr:hypothetical protein KUTeg_007460 [Tegillarca granosa]